jgi:hypothetical protein
MKMFVRGARRRKPTINPNIGATFMLRRMITLLSLGLSVLAFTSAPPVTSACELSPDLCYCIEEVGCSGAESLCAEVEIPGRQYSLLCWATIT